MLHASTEDVSAKNAPTMDIWLYISANVIYKHTMAACSCFMQLLLCIIQGWIVSRSVGGCGHWRVFSSTEYKSFCFYPRGGGWGGGGGTPLYVMLEIYWVTHRQAKMFTGPFFCRITQIFHPCRSFGRGECNNNICNLLVANHVSLESKHPKKHKFYVDFGLPGFFLKGWIGQPLEHWLPPNHIIHNV